MRARYVIAIAFVSAAASGYVALVALPVVSPQPWLQDQCTFGVISNTQYREFLDAARDLAAPHYGTFSAAARAKDSSEIDRILQARLDQFLNGAEAAHERLARMHAVMRAHGASLLWTDPFGDDPFANQLQRFVERPPDHGYPLRVIFNYRIPLFWHGDLRPAYNTIDTRVQYIIIGGRLSNSDPYLPTHAVDVGAVLPRLSPIDSPIAGVVKGICPPVPSSELQRRNASN